MQPRPQNEEDKLARQAVEEDSVFVQAVTKLADTREVVASEDIYARVGMKLIGRGTRLSGELYDRLVTHKLLKPIEHSLSISDALDARQLVSLMQDEARHVPSLAPLFAQPELLKQLGREFSQLTVRLAVMQSDRPKLFQHVLISAVVGTALGISGKLPREELQALSLASVFHDVGELCIQPTFLEPGHQMTALETTSSLCSPHYGLPDAA